MPDLGVLGDLVDQADRLVDDRAKEIEQGTSQAADLVADKVSTEEHGTVHNVADGSRRPRRPCRGRCGEAQGAGCEEATVSPGRGAICSPV